MKVEYSRSLQFFSDLWKRAEVSKDRKAEYQLALLYLSIGKEAEAVPLLRRSAKQKYTDAMFALGVCCETGRGVRRDNKAAIKWYKAAANGVTNDLMTNPYPEEAAARKLVQFLMRDEDLYGFGKAEDKDPDAAEIQNRLGHKYYYGQGAERNISRAVELFKESAKSGNEAATQSLAEHFEKEKNYKESVKYYKKYAEMQIKYRRRRLGW